MLNELVSEDMVREFSENEVHRAILECEGSKSSKLDGVKFDFVKEFWSDISGDFLRVISDFHAHDRFVKGANCSFLALIPKKTSPEKISDFPPISLIRCIYKVISKVLANRLKKENNTIISRTNPRLYPKKQILVGIVVENEVIEEARQKKKEAILFKVHFEKAYDSCHTPKFAH